MYVQYGSGLVFYIIIYIPYRWYNIYLLLGYMYPLLLRVHIHVVRVVLRITQVHVYYYLYSTCIS